MSDDDVCRYAARTCRRVCSARLGTDVTDEFGTFVRISGTTVIASARLEDDANTNSGKAYLVNSSTGSTIATIDNPSAFGTSQNDQFGSTTAIDGNYCVVTAQLESGNGQ